MTTSDIFLEIFLQIIQGVCFVYACVTFEKIWFISRLKTDFNYVEKMQSRKDDSFAERFGFDSQTAYDCRNMQKSFGDTQNTLTNEGLGFCVHNDYVVY